MERVLSKGGRLYLVTSVGERDVLEFNAHRVFNPNTIVTKLKGLKLERFLYRNDWELVEVGINKELPSLKGIHNTCGVFIFEK